MRFICGRPTDKRVLVVMLAILGALILAFALTGCAEWEEPIDTELPRQKTNEKVKPIFNDDGSPIGDFLIRAGHEIKHMKSYHGYTIYRIRVDMGRDVAGIYKVYTVWVYYE
jgi:hypothetical protein